MKRFTIFHKGKVWGEFDKPHSAWLNFLPEGSYVYCRDASGTRADPGWLRKDLSPASQAELPKEILTLALLLDIK
jgi:hypothetical protein